MVCARIVDSVTRYFDRIFAAFLSVDGNVYILTENFKLIDGGGTIDVAGHEQRTHAFLALKLFGEFA